VNEPIFFYTGGTRFGAGTSGQQVTKTTATVIERTEGCGPFGQYGHLRTVNPNRTEVCVQLLGRTAAWGGFQRILPFFLGAYPGIRILPSRS